MESCLLGLLCLHGLTWNEQLKKYCNFCQSKKLIGFKVRLSPFKKVGLSASMEDL